MSVKCLHEVGRVDPVNERVRTSEQEQDEWPKIEQREVLEDTIAQVRMVDDIGIDKSMVKAASKKT